MTANSIIGRRNVKLDFLRVLAIIGCIVSHALMAEPSLSLTEYHWIILFMPDTAAIFIMASGAVILERPGRCDWRYVWYRMSTFLPEFIIFSLLYVFMDNACGMASQVYSTLQRICYMFVIPTWAPGWFILALIGVYLVMPFIASWVTNATKRQVEIALAIWLTGTILPVLAPHVDIYIPDSAFGTIFNYAGYMLLGYYLQHWPFANRSFKFKFGFFALTIGIGIVFGYFLGKSGAKWGYINTLGSGLSITIVMMSLLLYGAVLLLPDKWFKGLFARIVVRISIVSLGIYCVHWLVIGYWAIPRHIDWITGTLVALAVSIPLAWLMRTLRLLIRSGKAQ